MGLVLWMGEWLLSKVHSGGGIDSPVERLAYEVVVPHMHSVDRHMGHSAPGWHQQYGIMLPQVPPRTLLEGDTFPFLMGELILKTINSVSYAPVRIDTVKHHPTRMDYLPWYGLW